MAIPDGGEAESIFFCHALIRKLAWRKRSRCHISFVRKSGRRSFYIEQQNKKGRPLYNKEAIPKGA